MRKVVCLPKIRRGDRTKPKLADNALNARLPRHFADGRNGDRARRWGQKTFLFTK